MGYRPLDIKKLVSWIALEQGYSGTANYLKASQIVDIFNELGYGDSYGSNGIEAAGMVANPSRTQYTKQRVDELKAKRRIPELVTLLLGSIGDPEGLVKKIKEEAPLLLDGVDTSAYVNPFEAPKTIFDRIEKGKYPIVFISYSWDSETHKAWVLKFAEDLKSKGILVLLDQKYEDGGDLVDFMRKGIRVADRVLVIGTPAYKEKAENHNGGAKLEDQIINIDLYHEFTTTKYIPCLRFGSFTDSFTEYLSVRKGFDFSKEEKYLEELERLANSIINPSSGNIPNLKPIARAAIPAVNELSTANMEPQVPPVAIQSQIQYAAGGMNTPQTQTQTQTVNIVMQQPAATNAASDNKETFARLYLPVFDKMFEFVDLGNYTNWTYGLAVNGETEIAEERYDVLVHLCKFCKSRANIRKFAEFDDLILNVGELIGDLLKTLNKYSEYLPGKIRVEKIYNRDMTDNSLLMRYDNHVFLISDLCLELTRLLNHILTKIREIVDDYKITEGLLYIESIHDDLPLEYRATEITSKPYPGLPLFEQVRLTRGQTFGRVPDVNSHVK